MDPLAAEEARVSGAGKRAFDLVVSSVILAVLAPVLAVIAIIIRFDSRGPAIYVQPRIGQNGRVFRLYKFRTMAHDADARLPEVLTHNMHARDSGDARLYKIPNDPRVTRAGRVLRRYSLDELPQLFNVVKGEMSLVGPRPLMLMEDAHVGGWALRRRAVRPGITGLWQVSGRNKLPFEDMMRMDCKYIEQWTFGEDMRLLLRTVPTILAPEEAS